MRGYSANLGFLWADLPLTEAIRAARRAGFAAVEMHWPYATPATEIRAALEETSLPLVALNTRPGGAGEFGLSALPGREAEARAAIDEALAYATATGAQAVHVMAGNGGADATFREALRYACGRAAPRGLTVLIEPLNRHDAPGYFLRDTTQAAALIESLALPGLKLMFDAYHVARTEAPDAHSLRARFDALRPLIGHVQIAGVPDRGRPDRGTIDIASLVPSLGWDGHVGAEYRPDGAPEASLDWLPRAG